MIDGNVYNGKQVGFECLLSVGEIWWSMYLPNPSTKVRMWDKVSFKQIIPGLNSEFSFYLTGFLASAIEPSLLNYLNIDEEGGEQM